MSHFEALGVRTSMFFWGLHNSPHSNFLSEANYLPLLLFFLHMLLGFSLEENMNIVDRNEGPEIRH